MTSPLIDPARSKLLAEIRFYFRLAVFGFKEQFSNVTNGLVGLALFPFFMFVISKLWQKFNGNQSSLSFSEMGAYVGATEILFMTFFRSASLNRAYGDFSMTLARPRPWLMMQFAEQFGITLGTRSLYCVIYFPVLILFGNSLSYSLSVTARLALLLVPLGIIQSLIILMLSSARVRWEMVQHLTLPFSKIFLVFGGVFGPLSDYTEPSRRILLSLPSSDLFFQPAYFCVKGEFFSFTFWTWGLRLILLTAVLFFGVVRLFRWAKVFHQSYGG